MAEWLKAPGLKRKHVCLKGEAQKPFVGNLVSKAVNVGSNPAPGNRKSGRRCKP